MRLNILSFTPVLDIYLYASAQAPVPGRSVDRQNLIPHLHRVVRPPVRVEVREVMAVPHVALREARAILLGSAVSDGCEGAHGGLEFGAGHAGLRKGAGRGHGKPPARVEAPGGPARGYSAVERGHDDLDLAVQAQVPPDGVHDQRHAFRHFYADADADGLDAAPDQALTQPQFVADLPVIEYKHAVLHPGSEAPGGL